MAARLYLTVYAPDDLPTETAHIASKSLGTVDDCTELAYTHHLHGTGSLKLRINRNHPSAALLIAGRYVIVHSDIGPIGGAFLEETPVDLSATKGAGDEWMAWTGRGAISVLENAVMDMDSSITGGQDPIEGFWDLSNQGDFAGASNGHPIPMMKRALNEADANTPPALTMVDHSSWDYDLDSDGVAPPFWGEIVFGVDIGDDLLGIAGRMSQLGSIVWQMSPIFDFDAHLTYGTSKAGAFGAGTIRFEKGVNIADKVARKVRGRVHRTHLIVGGADRTYVTVADPDWTSGDPVHWGFMSVGETADEAALYAAGLANIEARKRQTDAWSFPQHDHGDDPTNGIYEPGPPGTTGAHYWVGDIATLHTGTGPYDANAEPVPIAAITWQLKTGDEANGDYWVIPEVGSTFAWTPGPSYTAPPGSQIVPCVCPSGPTLPTEEGAVCTAVFHWTGGSRETLAAIPSLDQPSLIVPPVGSSITVSALDDGHISNEYSGGQSVILPAGPASGAGSTPNAVLAAVTPGTSITVSATQRDESAGGDQAWIRAVFVSGSYGAYAVVQTETYLFTAATAFEAVGATYTVPPGATGVAVEMGYQSELGSLSVCTVVPAAAGDTTQPPGTAYPGTPGGPYAGVDHVHPPAVVFATAPTVNDDSGDGYEIGLIWVNTATDTAYILLDDTVGAAVWEEIGAGGLSEAEVQTLIDASMDGYQRESEKGAANGYASLDASTLVPITQLPTGTGPTQVAIGSHTHVGGSGDGGLPLTAVVNGVPELVWDENNSLIGSGSGSGGGVASHTHDHGDLTGLADDDHTAYADAAHGHDSSGAPYRQIGCVLRKTGGAWSILDDSGHQPVGVTSVSADATKLTLTYAFTAAEVVAVSVTTDETWAASYHAGASVGLSSMDIYLKDLAGAAVNPTTVPDSATANLWVLGLMEV